MKYQNLLCLFLLLPSLAIAQNKQLDEYVQDCKKTLGVMEHFLEVHGMSLQAICEKDAQSDLLWDKSGNPIVYVRKQGCEFLGVKGINAEECLPEKLQSNIKAIKISASIDASVELVMKVGDKLREIGVQKILIGTNE